MVISINTQNYEKNLIRSVKSGVISKTRKRSSQNALLLATYRELRADLETRLKFQHHIVQTS